MFKELFAYLEKSEGAEDEASLLETFPDLKDLLQSASYLPFINDLRKELTNDGASFDELVRRNEASTIVKKILFKPGLGYADLPKGLIRFHSWIYIHVP